MIKLNPSAGEILNQCNGSNSAGDIVACLQQKFPDADDISADIFEFFGIAQQQRWLNHE
jgi:pyrroloquinoline quinone biosynthesis protein D